jgi:hypothetical protein
MLSILGSAHANPTMAHMKGLKKVLRYRKGTPIMSLTLVKGARTTHFNSQALLIQTRATTARKGA